MRTKEEVQKMLGKAVNACTSVPERSKKQREKQDKIWMAIQVLNWVVSEGEDPTKGLENRIDNLVKEIKEM